MTLSPLDGLWQMVRAELSGDAAPELIARRTTLELVAGTYLVRFHGEIIDRGSFTLEAEGLRLRGESGPNAGRIIPGIYQHVGDRLRICYGLDGAVPADFRTATNQQRYLATYRRL